MTKRAMLLVPTRAYRTEDYIASAERLGIELCLANDRCHVLAETWPEGALPLDFRDPDRAAATIVESAREKPLSGIVATDEITAIIAARASAQLGLPCVSPEAAAAAGNKLRLRQTLAEAGLPQPRCASLSRHASLAEVAGYLSARQLDFPVVIKPLHLSGSRGVMRVDTMDELAKRWPRLLALLGDPEVRAKDPEAAETILVESFVPGREVAFEGILQTGTLHALAIFDKPDPLDGPFFPETLYVTPSREPVVARDALASAVAAAARAIGLENGPVHAELRLPPSGYGGPVVLELAARSIGGLCGRIFAFATRVPLEDLVMAQAAGVDIAERAGLARDSMVAGGASGCLMIPVPGAGVLRSIDGIEEALEVAGICDVVITARPGEVVVPLPEGQTYMGFAFARSEDWNGVIEALRAARGTPGVRYCGPIMTRPGPEIARERRTSGLDGGRGRGGDRAKALWKAARLKRSPEKA